MDINEFARDIEKPIFSSLEELFDIAKLSPEEREIFLKHKKYCEFWLLRSKNHSASWEGRPNFIQNLARVLINLQLSRVTGPKDHYVKEMFSDKKIHRVYKTRNGIRSTSNSNRVFNTYFELEIMSFFLENGFDIELSKSKKNGEKIPEFVATKSGFKLNVEAKKLDIDSIDNNIFGDVFIDGFGHKQTDEDLKKGYQKIQEAFERNYINAMKKYEDIPNDEYFILFFSTYIKISYMGKPTVDFINNLPCRWRGKKYKKFVGIVLPDMYKTYLVENKKSDVDINNNISNLGEFNNYLPTVIKN